MSDKTERKNMIDGVCFSNAVKVCVDYQKQNGGAVALVSRDADYFSLSKKIKDEFENLGVTLNNVTLDDNFVLDPNLYLPLFCFKDDVKTIIAVGNSDLINLARYFATMFKLKLVAVLTEVSFMTALSKTVLMFLDKIPQEFSVKSPDICVIDLTYLAGLKKQAYADAYCQVASKLVALFDKKVDALLKGESFIEFERILQIISSLTKITSDGNPCKISIINAQLRIGQFMREIGDFSGSERVLSIVLSNIKSGSVYENEFFANKPLIKLYEAFLRVDMLSAMVSPNYNLHIKELGECLNCSELDIIKKYKPLDFETLKKYVQIIKDGNLIATIKKLASINEKLEENYKFVYKAKQKRADFETKEFLRALNCCGYLTNSGLLKIISDSGALETLSD